MLLYLILGVLIVTAYKLYKLFKCPKELENIPALPLSTYFSFAISNLEFSEKMDLYYQPYFNKYGVIRVFSYNGWTIFFANAKLSKEISENSDIFEKPDFKNANLSLLFKRLIGQNTVISANGSNWKRHRKIINPIFNQTWSNELFGKCAQDLIDEWEKVAGNEVKIHDKIQRMTLDVLGKAIFNIDFKSVKNTSSKLYNLYYETSEQILGNSIYIILPFLENLPFFRRPELAQKLNEYHEFIQGMINQKKEELKKGNLGSKRDLVSALVQSNENESVSKLKMEEIRDNLNAFIAAGHDTTSNTISTTLYYLARYPDIQDKLRAQIFAAMDNPNQVQIPTTSQLKNIPLLDMINKESMRIMSTIYFVPRRANSTYSFSNGLVIPEGTPVFLYLWGIHHNPSAFHDPYKFKPERFADKSSEESKNFQSFILGNRTCIGSTFSPMEQRVTLAMLLQKFEFSISPDNPDYHKLRITSSAFARPQDLTIRIKLRL